MTMHVVRVPEGLDPADLMLAGHSGDEFRELAENAQTLLQFQVRSVLSSHDLAKPDQRTRAFTLLRGVLAEAAGPLERDDEVRYVADRLSLSEESVRYLLSTAGASAGGRPAAQSERQSPAAAAAASAGERLLTGVHELEVRFLAACLAVPVKGRAFLATIDESFFASPPTRSAYGHVSARLKLPHAGEDQQTGTSAQERPEGESEVFSEIIIRSQRESFDDRVAEELFLRLQEAKVSRLVNKLKIAVRTDETGTCEAQLVELEAMRRKLRESIRLIPVEE